MTLHRIGTRNLSPATKQTLVSPGRKTERSRHAQPLDPFYWRLEFVFAEHLQGTKLPNRTPYTTNCGRFVGLVEAYNNNDIDRLLSYCEPNVAVTWQNGETSIGREAVRHRITKR